MPARFRSFRSGPLAIAALAGLTLLSTSAAQAAPFTITAPIAVPLYWIPISLPSVSAPLRKLGIYLSLGGSTTPQLFEFDTGGVGFYPAYSDSVSWWGSEVVTNHPYKNFQQGYNSGYTYTGDVVTTTVGLFSGPTATAPLFTAGDVVLGKSKQISNRQGDSLWSPSSTGSTPPPLLGAFWGDFGMAPKQGQQGQKDNGSEGGATIDSLISQLQFSSPVTAGYRVHAASENPWVQFGLGSGDLMTLPTSFPLNSASLSSPTGVPYYDPKVITGSLALSLAGEGFANSETGIIFDTGAFTTIHQGGSISLPAALVVSGSSFPQNYIQPGTTVVVSGPSTGLATFTPFLSFEAGTTFDQNLVAVQTDSYYLNTGLLPFLSNDIIVNLQDAQLTLVPQPAPAPLAVPGVAVASAFARRLRRLRRRARQL